MVPSRYLAELTYEECSELAQKKTVVLLPMGPLEAHGPHLPLGVDIHGAQVLADMSSIQLQSLGIATIIAPVLPYTLAEVAMPFAGTVTLRKETVKAVLLDIASSLQHHGFRHLVIICHHLERPNLAVLHQAAGELKAKGMEVLVSAALEQIVAQGPNLLQGQYPHWDFHAGEAETSFCLWKYPHLVKKEILAGLPPNWSDIRRKFHEGARDFIEAGAPRCYLGDPALATADLGRKLYQLLAKAIAAEIEKWLSGL